jgi:hypothetical protein
MHWRNSIRKLVVWATVAPLAALPGTGQQGHDSKSSGASAPTAKPDPRHARKAVEKGLAAEQAED